LGPQAGSPNSASCGRFSESLAGCVLPGWPAGANTGESMLRVSPKMDEITKLLK